MNARQVLTLLLTLAGIVMTLAFLAVLMPTEWMAATHRAIGLGELPRAPIVEYLTRSISALYGIHGILLLFVVRDLDRYRPIVRFVGITNVMFGAAMVCIDLAARLPAAWTLFEGPPIAAFGLLIIGLERRIEERQRASTTPARPTSATSSAPGFANRSHLP